MGGFLTTHVLDTARGRPAAGMRVELFRLDRADQGRNLLTATSTNAEGRTDAPLVEEGELSRGVYELVMERGLMTRAELDQALNPEAMTQPPPSIAPTVR